MNDRLNLTALAISLAMALASASTFAKDNDHEDHEHHAQHQEHGEHMQLHDMASPEGDDPHAHHRAMVNKTAGEAKSSNIDLREHELLNQNGKSVRFVNDVIGDKIIVMAFVYTACTTICPILSAVMEQVQNRLGDSLGKDVAMVSMTVDPTRDTPQRLKAYAAKHKSKPGWSWLTGPKTVMDDVLTGLGAFSTNFEDHAPMVLVGDGQSGEWSRLFGFPNVDRIIETVNALRVARNKMAGG